MNRKEKFLRRSICWRSDGLTWTGDVKLAKEALEGWDMCASKVTETPSVTVEPDAQSFLDAEYMSKTFAAKSRRTAAKLKKQPTSTHRHVWQGHPGILTVTGLAESSFYTDRTSCSTTLGRPAGVFIFPCKC